MRKLVVYDSQFGNTEQVARAIAAALGCLEEAGPLQVGAVKPEQLEGLDLLVVGSPTQRFNATPAITNLLKILPNNSLKGVQVAAFDTRFPQREIDKTPALAFFARLWGRSAYAAKHIAVSLRRKGGEPIVPPEGFYVGGMEGPLLEGELDRAAQWGTKILAAL